MPPSRRDGYLVNIHSASLKFWFGSDAITQSYTTWTRPTVLAEAVARLDETQRAKFLAPRHTPSPAR